MRKLIKPRDKAGDVFIECIKNIRDSNLKSKLANCKNLIIDGEIDFDTKIGNGQLHTIIQERIFNNNVTAIELNSVYTNKMVPKNSPGRKYYDKLMIAVPYEQCPFCSHRTISTLDHYLPKTNYPRLSVVPVNLVPSCFDCNKSKLTKFPNTPSEVILHPYYDNVEDEVWLVAEVCQTTPPSILFNVVNVSNWSNVLNERVKFHFDSLRLGKLYATQAAVEISQLSYNLEKIFNKSGEDKVREYLLDGAESRSHSNKNSWQTAMYAAMANDEWFCNGGFKLQL